MAQRARKLGLVKVVLVLANADGLGRDLDELCQRVLQSSRNGNGAAQGNIVIGKFLRRQL